MLTPLDPLLDGQAVDDHSHPMDVDDSDVFAVIKATEEEAIVRSVSSIAEGRAATVRDEHRAAAAVTATMATSLHPDV